MPGRNRNECILLAPQNQGVDINPAKLWFNRKLSGLQACAQRRQLSAARFQRQIVGSHSLISNFTTIVKTFFQSFADEFIRPQCQRRQNASQDRNQEVVGRQRAAAWHLNPSAVDENQSGDAFGISEGYVKRYFATH